MAPASLYENIRENVPEIADTSFNAPQENENEGNTSSAQNELAGDGSANENILGPVEKEKSAANNQTSEDMQILLLTENKS